MKKRVGLSLGLGAALLLVFILLAVLGPVLSPYSVDFAEKFYYLEENDSAELYMAPHAPSTRHVFGTDRWGYDLYTLILDGARYTVLGTLLIACLRLVIGTALGMSLAASHRQKSGRVSPAGSLPGFILLYFILYGLNFNPPYSPFGMFVLQGMLATLLGVPRVAAVVRLQAVTLQRKSHVSAARSVGAGKLRIAFFHVLPLMREQLLMTWGREAISTLSLFGTLGVFNIFIGGTLMTDRPTLYHSITNEWAGLVGQYYSHLQGSSWLLFFPLIFYVAFLLSLYILTLGLEALSQRSLAGAEYYD